MTTVYLKTKYSHSHPYMPTNAHNLYKIENHPYTWVLLHVSALNHLPQGYINTKGYKINTANLHINCLEK